MRGCGGVFYGEFLYLILSGPIQSAFYLMLFCTFVRIIPWKSVKCNSHSHSHSTDNDDVDVPDEPGPDL